MILLFNLFTYSNQLSDLKNEINNTAKVEEKVKLISENYNTFLDSDLIDNEKFLLNIANQVDKSKNIKDSYKFDFYYLLANLYKSKKEYEQAIEYNFKAFQIAERSTVVKNLSKYYLLFGELYFLMGEYQEAVEYDLLGLKLSEEKNDTSLKIKFLTLLGKVNYAVSNYDSAEEYLLEALELDSEKPNIDNITEINLYLARVYIANQKLEKAEKYLIENDKLLSSKQNTLISLNNNKELISVNYINGNYNNALEYSLEALSLAKILKENSLENDVKLYIAKIYLKLKLYKQSKDYLEDLTKYIISNSSYANKLDYYKTYSELSAQFGDYKTAFDYQTKSLKIKDTLMQMSKTNAIKEALIKFDTEAKERDLELSLNKAKYEKQRVMTITVIFISFAVLVIILAAFVFYRAKKTKVQNELLKVKSDEIEEQRKELESLNNELTSTNASIQEINHFLSEQEIELRNLNATKDKFLSIIAHDLKNPIAGIMLTSELLCQYIDSLDKEKLVKKIGEINSASIRLKELLETLLEWARATTGQIPFEPEPIQFDESIERIGQLFKSNLQNKNIELRTENIAKCKVFADKKMIDTIIRNIVSNAIKFTPENGNITISTESFPDKERLNIKDTGVGIPQDKIPLVFDMASNYSTLGTKKEKGTGLGLILCKEFVEKNNGKIELSSEVNKGTQFSVTFNKYLENDKLSVS